MRQPQGPLKTQGSAPLSDLGGGLKRQEAAEIQYLLP